MNLRVSPSIGGAREVALRRTASISTRSPSRKAIIPYVLSIMSSHNGLRLLKKRGLARSLIVTLCIPRIIRVGLVHWIGKSKICWRSPSRFAKMLPSSPLPDRRSRLSKCGIRRYRLLTLPTRHTSNDKNSNEGSQKLRLPPISYAIAIIFDNGISPVILLFS